MMIDLIQSKFNNLAEDDVVFLHDANKEIELVKLEIKSKDLLVFVGIDKKSQLYKKKILFDYINHKWCLSGFPNAIVHVVNMAETIEQLNTL